MSVRFDALLGLLVGYLSDETAESERELRREARKPKAERRAIPHGFVEKSETWEAAQLLGLPIIEAKSTDDVQEDMFEAPLTPRFLINVDWLDEIPMAFGGEPPDDVFDEPEELGTCIAWDDKYVMFWCPRGVCSIERSQWDQGWRDCPGC